MHRQDNCAATTLALMLESQQLTENKKRKQAMAQHTILRRLQWKNKILIVIFNETRAIRRLVALIWI